MFHSTLHVGILDAVLEPVVMGPLGYISAVRLKSCHIEPMRVMFDLLMPWWSPSNGRVNITRNRGLGFRVWGFRVQQLQFEQSLVELATLVSEIIPPTLRFP